MQLSATREVAASLATKVSELKVAQDLMRQKCNDFVNKVHTKTKTAQSDIIVEQTLFFLATLGNCRPIVVS